MTHYQRKQRRAQKRGSHKARNTVFIALGVLLAVVGIGIASVLGYVISIAATTPNIDELKPINKGETSAVYAANGRPHPVMSPIASRLNEGDMKALSDYIAGLR